MEGPEGPISFADLGITVADSTKNTFLGKVRSCNTLSKLEIIFLAISLLSVLVSLGITIQRLIVTSKSSADFTFAVVLFINICFCLYYVLSGVFFERPYEIGMLVLATAVVWLYIVLNYAISVKGPFKLTRLIVSSALSPCVIVMGVLIARNYLESNNLIFRTVGAQAILQDMCNTMFVFFDLLKADLQVSISLALMILTSGQDLNLKDKILLPLSLTFGVASFLTGYISVRFENKTLAIVHALLWPTMPTYAVYLIIQAAKYLQSSPDSSQMKTSLNAVIFVAAFACLVVRVVSVFFGIKAFLNFEKGLSQKVFGTHVMDHTDTLGVNRDQNQEEA